MPTRGPFSVPTNRGSLPTLAASLEHAKQKPKIGVTQGGSSRKGAPAKRAATDGLWRPSKTGKSNAQKE